MSGPLFAAFLLLAVSIVVNSYAIYRTARALDRTVDRYGQAHAQQLLRSARSPF